MKVFAIMASFRFYQLITDSRLRLKKGTLKQVEPNEKEQ